MSNPFILDPSMSEEFRQNIANNFVTLAMARSEKKRTLLVAKDEKRSHRQNRYYWASMRLIKEHMMEHFDMAHIEEVWHEKFKLQFAIPRIETIDGGEVKIYRSTTDMTKKEFAEYMDKVVDYCAYTWGCQIPPPEHGMRVGA